MNKLIIVLLAICLVSVHAFVKRDAPEATTDKNSLQDLTEKLEEGAKQFIENTKKVLNPENIQKTFEELANNAKTEFDKITQQFQGSGAAEAPKQ